MALSILKYVSLDLGGQSDTKTAKLKKLRESFRSNVKQFFQSSEFVELAKRTVNESIVKEWGICMSNKLQAAQASFVAGWYADDPLDVGRITVRYAKASPEVRKSILITAVTTNNLILLPQEPIGFFGKEVVPAIRVGKEISLGENVTTTFQRSDRYKAASIVISFGKYGDVQITLPVEKIVVAPTNYPPTKVPVSKRVEKIGGKRMAAAKAAMAIKKASASPVMSHVNVDEARAYLQAAANDSQITIAARSLVEMSDEDVIRIYNQLNKLQQDTKDSQ